MTSYRSYEITVREFVEGREVQGGRFILEAIQLPPNQESLTDPIISNLKNMFKTKMVKWLRIKQEADWSEDERNRE